MLTGKFKVINKKFVVFINRQIFWLSFLCKTFPSRFPQWWRKVLQKLEIQTRNGPTQIGLVIIFSPLIISLLVTWQAILCCFVCRQHRIMQIDAKNWNHKQNVSAKLLFYSRKVVSLQETPNCDWHFINGTSNIAS